MSKLEPHIDEIISLLVDGDTFRTIADKFGVALSTLHEFMSKPEHSARVRLALEYSASTFDDKAEEVLLKAPKNLTEIQRARELAQHYRWKAGKRCPKKYGDKVDVTSGGETIKPVDLTALVGTFMKPDEGHG